MPLIGEYDEEHGPPGAMRGGGVFEPPTPIKIREPRPSGAGKVARASPLLVVIGFGVYHLVVARTARTRRAPASTAAGRANAVRRPSPRRSGPTAPRTGAAGGGHQADRDPGCWVGLRNATGQQLYQGIDPGGQSEDLAGASTR